MVAPSLALEMYVQGDDAERVFPYCSRKITRGRR